MSSPGGTGGSRAVKPDLFEDLWKQLGETHRNTMQDLEAKVNKLKKDRYLDAQRLEVFHNRNQQLKEQNKTLQDAISHLEDRLRAGGCDRCVVLEEKLKRFQDQNLHVVTKLENEKNILQDENRKLEAELQRFKTFLSESKQNSSPEQEEGVIPDSPTMPSSLPAASKLRKRKRADTNKHVRYAEMPLSSNSLLHELNKDSAENPGRTEVLVPNTCEPDASQISSERLEGPLEAVAETCGLELLHHNSFLQTTEAAPSHGSSRRTWKHKLRLGPDSASHRSPSLLPRVGRFSEDDSVRKRQKEEGDPEAQTGGDAGVREGKHVESAQKEASCESPAFKKPQSKTKEADGKRRTSLLDLNAAPSTADGRSTVEPVWSVDPALSVFDGEQEGHEETEERRHADQADTDCTWVSHSVLRRREEDGRDRGDGKSGLGEKANDSLDLMFDTTAYGTYKSCNSPHSDQDGDEEEEEEEEDPREDDPGEAAARPSKSGQPTFKHVAVVRKKDERRKLKGTTCKECENYYSHLPEGDKQKKLSACSRHRFLYVPPCTPENFWEVGFPSTQTCVERGYIKEERHPPARLRRRQPFNALFSPKPNK